MGNHAIDGTKYALSPSWEKSSEFKEPFDYTLVSSGQTCLVRRLDMGDLLKLGVAEQLDFMSKELLAGDASEGAAPSQSVGEAIMKAENFGKMELMINKVVQAGVLQPPLHLPPLHENARQKGLIYIDSLPFGDRLELFSVVFDSEGLTDFREEQEPGVADVANVTSVQLPPDGPLGI